MREPIIWIWLSTFTRLVIVGDDYLAQPSGNLRRSAEIASIVAKTCRSIRVRDFPRSVGRR